MTTTDHRPWLQPGADVVLINTAGWNSRIAGQGTIDRVGKRDVVLTSGRRFRLSDLHEQGRSVYHADQIAAADDPRVVEIRAEDRRRAADVAARKAIDTWHYDRTNRVHLRAAIDALTALDGLLALDGEGDDE